MPASHKLKLLKICLYILLIFSLIGSPGVLFANVVTNNLPDKASPAQDTIELTPPAGILPEPRESAAELNAGQGGQVPCPCFYHLL